MDFVKGVGGVDAVIVPGHAGWVVLLYVGGQGAKDLVEGLCPIDVSSVPRWWVRRKYFAVGKGVADFSL